MALPSSRARAKAVEDGGDSVADEETGYRVSDTTHVATLPLTDNVRPLSATIMRTSRAARTRHFSSTVADMPAEHVHVP
jgi:hypothetical protein